MWALYVAMQTEFVMQDRAHALNPSSSSTFFFIILHRSTHTYVMVPYLEFQSAQEAPCHIACGISVREAEGSPKGTFCMQLNSKRTRNKRMRLIVHFCVQADDAFANYAPRNAFLFPGQGAQTVGMAKV